MSTQPAEPLSPRAFVDSHLRCPYDGKRMVIEIEYDLDGYPYERHVCLNCGPWTTRSGE